MSALPWEPAREEDLVVPPFRRARGDGDEPAPAHEDHGPSRPRRWEPHSERAFDPQNELRPRQTVDAKIPLQPARQGDVDGLRSLGLKFAHETADHCNEFLLAGNAVGWRHGSGLAYQRAEPYLFYDRMIEPTTYHKKRQF